MPGSFDKEMTIEHGCLKPGGPLGLADRERVLRLDFWILQDGAACMGFLPGPEGEIDEGPPGKLEIPKTSKLSTLERSSSPVRRSGWGDGQGKC